MAQENDVVLIYFEEKPVMFARIEAIWADYKPDWYHVKLLLLQVPLQPVTWILRNAYINGEEFTMNGNRMRMELVVCPEDPDMADHDDLDEELDDLDEFRDFDEDEPVVEAEKKRETKIISFADLKKR